jgi:hypothetical protein
LTLAIVLSARSHAPEDLLDSVKGIRIASRIPCDGSTNPREEVELHSTYSPGGWERSFRLDMFRSKYCRRLDLYFVCVFHGHDGWRPAWSSDSSHPPSTERFWLHSCSAWESADAAQYLLSGWYKEGEQGQKRPWKQAAVRKVSSNPETYEFTDPNGGTARVELPRK